MPDADKFEIRNETNTLQHVDAAGASKKVEPGETIEVTALVATGFYNCEGWVLLKNGEEVIPKLDDDDEVDEKPKASKPPKPAKPPPKPTPPAVTPDDQE